MKAAQARPFRGLFPGNLARSFRRLGVFGKDIAHYAGIPLLFALVINIVIGMMRIYATYSRIPLTDDGLSTVLWMFFLVNAYCVGIAIGTDEEESDTRIFLRRLPIPAYRVLVGKIAAGLFLMATYAVVALLAAALISGRGLELFGTVIQWYGKTTASGAHVNTPPIELTFALLLTGITAGLTLGSLSLAGIGGLAIMVGAAIGFDRFMANFIVPDYVESCSRWSMWIWVASMAGIYLWAYSKERPTRLFNVSTDSAIDYLRYKPSHGTAEFDHPGNRCFRSTFLLFSAAPLVLPFLLVWCFPWNSDGLGLSLAFSYILMILAGPFLGVSAWTPEERNSAKWFVYALPINRWEIFRQRMVGLCWRAVVMGLCITIGAMFIIAISEARSGSSQYHTNLFAFLAIVPTVFLSALTAAFLRLFLRLKLAAAAMTIVLMLMWTMELGTCLRNSVPGQYGDLLTSTLYPTYAFILLSAILLVCTGVAFCRTTLLEQPDSRRSSLLFVMMGVLVVWGGFFIAVSPFDIFRTILP